MKCLYCGKGIGPLRTLRDRDFCSEEHRAQSSERYRQQLVEALAPEPAPSRFADFIERPVSSGGPGPTALLCALPKAVPGEWLPAMRVEAAGIGVEQPDWILGKTLASTPMRLVWQDSAAPFKPSTQSFSFSVSIRPPQRPAAGAALTRLVAGNPTARPSSAATRLRAPLESLPYASVSMPEAAQIPAPVKAEAAAPQLQAAPPALGDLAAVGPVPPVIHAALAPSSHTTIAGPATPPAALSVPEFSLSPAVIASEARPLEVGPFLMRGDLQTAGEAGVPVAFEAHKIEVVLPAPPAAAASSSWIAAMQRARHALSTQSPRAETAMLPGASAAKMVEAVSLPEPQLQFAGLPMAALAATADPLPTGMPAASPSWHAALAGSNPLEPLGSHASPQVDCAPASGGALAGLVRPGTAAIGEAAGNRNLRTVPPAAAPLRTLAAHHELSALPAGRLAEMGSAPALRAEAPAPAAPPAAEPTWEAARTVFENRPLVPKTELALPRIDCRLSPAGALDGLGKPLRAELIRAVRSYAVLWTLRSAQMLDPFFRMDPIRTKFSDLLRADRSPFGQDLEDRPAKSKVLAFRRADARPARPKWQYALAAAAALLLAGVLRPPVAAKNLKASLPWHGMSIRQWMSERATRNFEDDFRAGLNQWKSVMPKSANSWAYNSDGFIHPGQLALYRPSVPLSDYRFEFMAQVETKSVDWVVRAKDANNYYALKFTVLQPGPRPLVAMVRYPVIGGNRGSRVQTPLRMMIHANTPYRVTVDVKGNRYRTFIEDQEADVWTDDHLKTGGVGFFSETGERARVYWVKLESHGDILGRICGLLSGKSGSAKEAQAMDYRHAGTDTNGSGNGGVQADEGVAELVRAMDAGERRPPLYFALAQLQYR